MTSNGAPVTNGERIVRIDERTERMEKDIVEINRKLDSKVDKEDCRDCGTRHDKAIEEAKQIAVKKVSRKELADLKEKVGEVKDDWKFWVVAGVAILSLVFDGVLGIKIMLG